METPPNKTPLGKREIPFASWLGIRESATTTSPPQQEQQPESQPNLMPQPETIISTVERIRQLGSKEIRLPKWTGLGNDTPEQSSQPKPKYMPPAEVVGPYSEVDIKPDKNAGISGITKEEVGEFLEEMFLWNFFPYAAMGRRRKRKPKAQSTRPSTPKVVYPAGTTELPVEPTVEPIPKPKVEDFSCCEKVSSTLEGLVRSIETISDDVQYAKASMDAIKESFKNISTVKSVDLRPQTIEMAGKKFLYYPGAPEGRQFYEKTAEGTAGANAPRGMKEALSRKVASAPQPTVNYSQVIQQTTNSNLKIVERLLAQEMPNQESKIAELLRKIAARESEGGALGMESDEQEAMLERALEKALTKVLRRMPEAAGGMGGGSQGGGGGGLADLASAAPTTSGGFGGPLRPNAPPTGGKKGILGRLGGLISRGGLAKLGGKAALRKLPLGIGLAFGLGFAAQRAMGGDYTGAAMEIGSGAASIVPGVGTAASLGIDATLAAKDAGAFKSTGVVPTQQIPTSVVPTQQTIYEREIQKEISKTGQSPLVSVSDGYDSRNIPNAIATPIVTKTEIPVREMTREQVGRVKPILAEPVIKTMSRPIVPAPTVPMIAPPTAPTVINNITNNRVAPSTKIPDEEQSQIRVFPTENTFNRLIAQDFDHPSAYHSMTMG